VKLVSRMLGFMCMPSFGERVGARGLPVKHCRCQAINRPDFGLQRDFREPSPGRNARVGSFFRPHLGRQPNNGPVILSPARRGLRECSGARWARWPSCAPMRPKVHPCVAVLPGLPLSPLLSRNTRRSGGEACGPQADLQVTALKVQSGVSQGSEPLTDACRRATVAMYLPSPLETLRGRWSAQSRILPWTPDTSPRQSSA